MKHRVIFNKNQHNALNAMSGDISYEDLSAIKGVSTMALKIKLANTKKLVRAFFHRDNSVCALAGTKNEIINYKNFNIVRQFMSKRGKIVSSRINGVSKKKQRFLSLAIKRARMLGLIPAVNYGDYKI